MGHLSRYVEEALRKCYVVPVARICNASCVFCATDVYDPMLGQEMMNADALPRVAEILVRAGVKRFEITGGGEPSLHPRLQDIIDHLRVTSSEYIKLYTNGSRLTNGERIDELNISRCAIDPTENQLLMRNRGGSPDIYEIVGRARSLQYRRIRLSVPIIHGGVDSLAKAIDFTAAVANLVDAVVFRPLYPATPEKNSFDPRLDVRGWRPVLVELDPVARSGMEVEVDVEGCFRSSQLILASNMRLYRDWTLKTPA